MQSIIVIGYENINRLGQRVISRMRQLNITR